MASQKRSKPGSERTQTSIPQHPRSRRARLLPSWAAGSYADELIKLAQLRDSSVLTEEEFGQQKAKLLA